VPTTNSINTAIYKLLAADETLTELCIVYKGAKRPGNATNPSVTVDTRRLECGEGEGIWVCDVVITSYVDVLSNRMPDMETHETIISQVVEILVDAELELYGQKAMPMFEEEIKGPEWVSVHDNETLQEGTFGLILIDFG